MRRLLTMTLAALAASCGEGDDQGSLGPQEQAIYRLDTFTDNKSSCEAEGPSALNEAGDHLIVFSSTDLFGEALYAHVCADPAGCRSDRQARLDSRGWSSLFDITLREKQGGDLIGILITSGFSMAGTCKDAEVTRATFKRPADGRVSLEARTVIVDHPPDGQGICWTDDTKKAAEGKPCSRLRVITGTRIEPL